MNAKKAGWLFGAIVVIYILAEILLGLTPLAKEMGVTGALVLSEAIMIVPCFFAWLLSRQGFCDVFGVHKVKPATIPLSIVFTWMLLPLVSCFNVFTLYFTGNEAVEIFDTLGELPMPVVALFAAVIAPLVEEWTFRGILYGGIRKNGSALQAMLCTAVMFGLFHMNLNQMAYAFALGIFFGALREVSGSIWPSVVCHMTINGGSTLLLLLEGTLDEELMEEAQAGLDMNAEMISTVLAVMLLMAAFSTALALGLLIRIAKTENALGRLQNILSGRKREKGRVLNVPMIIGIVLCVGVIILELVVEMLQRNMA
ncbi:MAG: CPBP family intramembrane metalloprotease [Lachnospiraceae bacterium]|nr:CPBP family intramembrane metalloprotease [Lachnospiraceae bacterium]